MACSPVPLAGAYFNQYPMQIYEISVTCTNKYAAIVSTP
jgi:hypothetical protein